MNSREHSNKKCIDCTQEQNSISIINAFLTYIKIIEDNKNDYSNTSDLEELGPELHFILQENSEISPRKTLKLLSNTNIRLLVQYSSETLSVR